MLEAISAIPAWVWILLSFAAGASFTQLIRNKIPILDYGHRCFAVRDQETAKLLLVLLKRFGLKENFTFSPGATSQTLLSDGTTVLIWFDESVPAELRQNGFSVVTADPVGDARWWARELEARGYRWKIHDSIFFPTDIGKKIVILESDAFSGWVMAFRRHSFAMGKRRALRKITPK